MKNYCGIAFLMIALFFVACKSDQKTDSSNAPDEGTQSTQEYQDATNPDMPIIQLPKEMPEQFENLSIPSLDGGTIERVTKHKKDVGGQIQVIFTSKLAPKEVEDNYIAAMKKMDWEVINSTTKPNDMGAYFSVYRNGDNQLIVNSIQHPKVKKTTTTLILMDLARK